MRALMLTCFAFFMSTVSAYGASCEQAAGLRYEDITRIHIIEYSLVGRRSPKYEFNAEYYPNGQPTPHYYARLTYLPRSQGEGDMRTDHPDALYHDIVAILRRYEFFAMRLRPAQALYLDGPEDTISASACGVKFSLGTVTAGEVNLDDGQGRRFFALEGALRTLIFAQHWHTP